MYGFSVKILDTDMMLPNSNSCISCYVSKEAKQCEKKREADFSTICLNEPLFSVLKVENMNIHSISFYMLLYLER